MATFIPYQPRHSAPAFMSNDIRASGSFGLADCALWPQSRRTHEFSKLNGDVDLLGRVGAAQAHVATPESLTVQETPQVSELDSIEDAGVDDSDDRGYCSDDSELPSLEELLSQARGRSGTSVGLNLKSTTTSEQPEPTDRRDGCSDTSSETEASPRIDAARGVFSGASRDNPIVLDESDDERENQRGAAAPCHDDRNLDTASFVDRRDSSPLSIVPSFADGAHGTQNSTGDYTLQNGENGDESRKEHEDNRSWRDSGCANEERAGGSEGQEIPASAGHIHDIFADYERRSSMKRPNQQAQKQRTTRCSSIRDYSDQTVVSSSSVKQSVCGDGSQMSSTEDVGIKEHARVVSDDPGLRRSPGVVTAEGPPSQPRQDGVESDCATRATLSQELSIADDAPLIPHETTDNTTRSRTGLASQSLSTRKRPHQSSESILALPGDPASKRPRRVTKESWKAREARELSEAKQAIASSHSRRRLRPRSPKRVAKARLTCDWNERNNQIADVEDVYLAEDGSIQCVVRWKASLVARENLVSKALHRQCEELFKKKYGTREWRTSASEEGSS